MAPRGVLRVTAPPSFLSVHRERVIGDFLARYPEVALHLDLTHRMVDLVEEWVHVAIRPTRPDDSSLVARRLGPAPLVVVASPAYLERAGVPEFPAALAAHACIRDTNFRFHPRWPFRTQGPPGKREVVEVRGPVSVNSPELVRALVLDGLGIGLVPEMLVAGDVAAGRLVELFAGTVDVDWSAWAITSQRRHLPARARVFLDHLAQAMAAGGPG